MSLTSDMLNVYPKLREIIKDSESKESPKKYIAFMSASVRGRWFAENYLSTRKTSGLKNCMIGSKCSFAKEIADIEVNMIKEIVTAKGISGNKSFQRVEVLLPDMLSELSKSQPVHKSSLVSLSVRLIKEIDKTQVALDNALLSFDEEPKEKKENDGILGKQNVAVEEIINHALSTLDSKLAHKIRTLLAKSDDKLLILQREIANAQ
jgi:hypothetical protein